MTSLELKKQIINYLKISDASLEDKKFLIKYIAIKLNDDLDLVLDITDSSYKSILFALCLFYNSLRLTNDNDLTRNRTNKAFNLLGQVDKLTDEELDDLSFELLKLNFSCGADLNGTESIVYKKIHKGKFKNEF